MKLFYRTLIFTLVLGSILAFVKNSVTLGVFLLIVASIWGFIH